MPPVAYPQGLALSRLKGVGAPLGPGASTTRGGESSGGPGTAAAAAAAAEDSSSDSAAGRGYVGERCAAGVGGTGRECSESSTAAAKADGDSAASICESGGASVVQPGDAALVALHVLVTVEAKGGVRARVGSEFSRFDGLLAWSRMSSRRNVTRDSIRVSST
jgi:hypothetical protein